MSRLFGELTIDSYSIIDRCGIVNLFSTTSRKFYFLGVLMPLFGPFATYLQWFNFSHFDHLHVFKEMDIKNSGDRPNSRYTKFWNPIKIRKYKYLLLAYDLALISAKQ